MPNISRNSQPTDERPDISLTKGSAFGKYVNAVFRQSEIAELCHELFRDKLAVTDALVAEIASADKEKFLPDPLQAIGGSATSYLPLVSVLGTLLANQTDRFNGDVYFNVKSYRKDPVAYLADHPFIRKAVMQEQATYLRTLFPYAVQVNIESGFKSKGTPGFYLSQQRAKVGLYRSDWFYLSPDEIQDFIHATVQRHTHTVPDHTFCRTVKCTGVGTVELLEQRSASAVYRFNETDLVGQYFTDGQVRTFDGLDSYRKAVQLDQIVCRYKYANNKIAFLPLRGQLVARYLETPFAEMLVQAGSDGFSLVPLYWKRDTDEETKGRVTAYITKKLKKYGKVLPFQKHIHYAKQ